TPPAGVARRLMAVDDEFPATIQPSDCILDPGASRRGRMCALTHGCVPHFRVRPPFLALSDRLSVCALNGLKLRLRKVGSPKNLQYQVRLAIDVAVDVVWKLSREPLLEVAVLLRRCGMRPQVISDCQLIREAEAVARTKIQVVLL